MRVVFAGTPAFATVVLSRLLDSHHSVQLVLTQPDRAAGRGLRPTQSPVKQFALARGIELDQPSSLKTPEALARLRSTKADAMVVAAYGLILPQVVLDLFPRGCINIHASLLPRWRGAAPIQRALLAGDHETGICIMAMDAGLDTGPIYLRESIPIASVDTAASLHDQLAVLGGRLIVDALDRIETGNLLAQPQASQGVTYATKIDKTESAIDWKRNAIDIERAVRAFNPVPGAHTKLDGAPLKIWSAQAVSDRHGFPGEVIATSDDTIDIACGEGSLAVSELQRAGSRRLPARDFLLGYPLTAGTRLGG
jgi:methionyl-tRNA formyltransferase